MSATPAFMFEVGFGIGPYDFGPGELLAIATASNVCVGTNPPYNATDLFTLYPQFGGTPTLVTGVTDGTTATVTGVSSIAGLLAGQYVTGTGIAPGSTIVSASGSTVVLSRPTTAAGNPVQLTVFTSPVIPAAVVNIYIYLATNSIFQSRWGEMWYVAMSLYIAHFLTLWAQGQASPNSNAAQIAASGMAIGIKTSKSAGDVSVGSTAILIEGAGSFNLTIFGQELATWGAVVGSGSALVW